MAWGGDEDKLSPSELNAAVWAARDFVTAIGPRPFRWEAVGDPTAWPQPGERDTHDEWREMNAGIKSKQ
jgi:hypothetical protein